MHSGGQAPLSLGHTILTETQTLVNEATLTPCLGSTVPRRYSHPIWITLTLQLALVHFVCTLHRSLAMTAGNLPPQSSCGGCFQPRVTEFVHGAGTGTSPTKIRIFEQLWVAVPSLSYSDTLKERGRWKLLFTATALKNIETVYNWGFRWHHCYHFFSSALPTFQPQSVRKSWI